VRGHVDDVAVGAVGGDAMSRHDGGETAEREAGYFGPAVANSPRMDELHQRITELVTRMGALGDAIERLTKIIAAQYDQIAALESLVGASPVESALVTSYPRLSVAQTTGHADDRR